MFPVPQLSLESTTGRHVPRRNGRNLTPVGRCAFERRHRDRMGLRWLVCLHARSNRRLASHQGGSCAPVKNIDDSQAAADIRSNPTHCWSIDATFSGCGCSRTSLM
jgi:hypothetical protein